MLLFIAVARVAMTQKASDYSFSSSDDIAPQRSPGDWLSSLCRNREKWERIEIRGGPSRRKMELIAALELDAEPDELFARVHGCATACGHAHVIVQAFQAGARRPSDMLAWPVPEPDEPDDDRDEMATSDPRNSFAACAGLLRQSYQFNQVLMNQLTALTTSHLMHLQAENKALREERGEMRSQVIEAEKALSDREMRAFQMQQTQLRDRVLAEGATSLVQAAATHLAALPPSDSPLTKAISRLASSMSPEQMAQLMGVLSADQQALFVSVLESTRAAKNGQASDGQANE